MNSKVENAPEPTLGGILLAPERLKSLRSDSLRLLEHKVQNSPGLKGMALRSGLALLKSTRADLLPRAVNRLLPVFITALEPYYAQCRAAVAPQPLAAGDFSAFLLQRRAAVVDTLMQSADALAAGSHNSTVRSFYTRLHSTIRSEIDGALPTLARRMDDELQQARP